MSRSCKACRRLLPAKRSRANSFHCCLIPLHLLHTFRRGTRPANSARQVRRLNEYRSGTFPAADCLTRSDRRSQAIMSDQKDFSVSVTRSKPNINVTPLIDVLLVMLIIFMVAAPLKPQRFLNKVPSKPDGDLPLIAHIDTLVVTINP